MSDITEAKRTHTVTFRGWQEDGLGGAFPLYNVMGPGFGGTTVTVGTLIEHGLQIPETPSLAEFKRMEAKRSSGSKYQEASEL